MDVILAPPAGLKNSQRGRAKKCSSTNAHLKLTQKEKPHRLPEPEDDLTDCCNACAALKYSDS